MIKTQPSPRQTKLRSSCDGCGFAKLKCDRTRPQCGRCRSLGMTCVYSVSRKMGKPPRDRVQGLAQSPFRKKNSASDKEGGGMNISDDSSFSPDLQDVLSWTYAQPNSGLQCAESTTIDASLFDFTNMNFTNDGLQCDEPRIMPTTSIDHDCYHDARQVLGNLSFQNTNLAPSMPGPFSNIDPALAQSVPLDKMLSVNRKSSDQLTHLLSCHCAQLPHLMLLYASIISRILGLYEQAGGGTYITPGKNPDSSMLALSPQLSESMACPPMSWSSTPTDMGDTYTPLSGGCGLTVAPTQVAVGSFDIDDQVQAVLQIQLVLSEIRRMGAIINQFSSQNTRTRGDSGSVGVEAVYQALGEWLRKDYTRVVDVLSSRLKKVMRE